MPAIVLIWGILTAYAVVTKSTWTELVLCSAWYYLGLIVQAHAESKKREKFGEGRNEQRRR